MAEEKKRVHWRKSPDAEGPDGRGYWESSEGRFRIAPNFRHTVNPDSYTVHDTMGDWTDQVFEGRRLRRPTQQTCDAVGSCKDWCERRVVKTML